MHKYFQAVLWCRTTVNESSQLTQVNFIILSIFLDVVSGADTHTAAKETMRVRHIFNPNEKKKRTN